MEQADAIVVGGGVAGLAAADKLARAGVRVILIEARDRLGGRIFTERRRGWPEPIELGAQFVHDGNDPFWQLVRKHRLPTRRVPPRHWRYNGTSLEPIADIAGAIERVTERIDARRMRGWTFEEFLQFKARLIAYTDRELASGFVEGFEAAPMDEMSAPALAGETLQDERQFVLPHGYNSLIDALARGWPGGRVNVYRQTPVRAIAWERGRVTVSAAGGTYRARVAVVTLPLAVLQAKPPARGAVQFTPALREKEEVWSKMPMGHVVRLSVRLDGRRWNRLLPDVLARCGAQGFGFVHARITGVPVWWNLTADSVLTGWVGGPAAVQLARQTPGGIREKALSSLSRVLGVPQKALRGAIADWATHNWTRDPFCRGAYSFIAAGRENLPARLRIAVGNTLFFAGEATADAGETGTVHGALASGVRAAAEMRRALGV